MKIKISAFCQECNKNESLNRPVSVEDIVEFNDENLYELTCQNGHKCFVRLQENKFELLFDQGAMALIDGYSRESVASIASSLERFIEYFLKVIAIHNKVPFDNYERTWKLMAKQSERQLGAFYFTQTREWGEVLFKLDDNETNFRNKVIHQGYIPTVREAINYGDYVLKLITQVLKKLNETHSKSIIVAGVYHLLSNGKSFPKSVSSTNASIPTIIEVRSIESDDFGSKSFEENLKEISKNGFYKDFYHRHI